jgi:hypothetical protein
LTCYFADSNTASPGQSTFIKEIPYAIESFNLSSRCSNHYFNRRSHNSFKPNSGRHGNLWGVTITLPFNDVMASPLFCQIAAAYYSGLANGTGDGTTYSPTQTVTREQMAAFISRTMDQSLKRGSERAVAKKWWTPQDGNSLGLTDVGVGALAVEF